MSYTAASHQGASRCFGFILGEFSCQWQLYTSGKEDEPLKENKTLTSMLAFLLALVSADPKICFSSQISGSVFFF